MNETKLTAREFYKSRYGEQPDSCSFSAVMEFAEAFAGLVQSSEIENMKAALRELQIIVHCGQYHQWKDSKLCRDKLCIRINELLSVD